jgi:ABC-2 type transport system permease protein
MRYVKVFLSIYSARLSKDFSLPLSTQAFMLMGSICYFFLHYIGFKLLLQRFSFPGWTVGESWVLMFTFEIFTYLAFFLFWNGLNKTVQDINTGRFDMVVSKPMSSLFITFFRGGGFHNIFCATLGFILLFHTFISYQLPISFVSCILYLGSLIVSLWVFFCFAVCFISLNFKYGRLTATPVVAFQIQEVYKYPSTLYQLLPIAYSLIPISLSLFTTLPAAILIQKSLPQNYYFIYFVFLIIITLFSRWAWHRGLRSYSSASS